MTGGEDARRSEASASDDVGALRSRVPADKYLPVLVLTADSTMAARHGALELVAATAAIEVIPRLPADTFISIDLSPAVAMLSRTASLLEGSTGGGSCSN